MAKTKIFAFVSLWVIVWVIAVTIKVFLGEYVDGLQLAKAISSLIKAIPTGVCVGVGVALHNKLKAYFAEHK